MLFSGGVLLIMGAGIVFGLALDLAYRYLLVRLIRREVVEPAVRQMQNEPWTVVRNPGLPSGRKLLNCSVPGIPGDTRARVFRPDVIEGDFREL